MTNDRVRIDVDETKIQISLGVHHRLTRRVLRDAANAARAFHPLDLEEHQFANECERLAGMTPEQVEALVVERRQ